MRQAYGHARESILATRGPDWKILDCGAHDGSNYSALNQISPVDRAAYCGIEWSAEHARQGRDRGLDVREGDLNKPMPFEDESFDCVFGLSVLEHLLNGCLWIREARRVLRPGGRLVILTPNISTYFTIALLVLGKMPSSGPHPDSNALIENEISLSVKELEAAVEGDTPTHRHLVVFSYRVLKKYLRIADFEDIEGRGFGLYPFPNFLQWPLEKLDPWHCHQMVFTVRKPAG